MEFVFIIGVSRTGSKIYMNVLNQNSDINLLTELNFFAPRWVRKDFRYYVKKYLGDINSKTDVLKLIDLMYSGIINGTFWTIESWDISGVQNSIIGINKEKLTKEILNSNMTYKEIFSILIKEHTIARNKKRGGAKFPVDISYLSTLMEWFPDSQFVHIIRDPRAIYSSMILKDLKNAPNLSKSKKNIIRITRLFYLWLQYKQAIKMHKKYKDMNNYYLSRFEDIVLQPETYLKQLCDFLKIDYKKEMLLPSVVDSSYKESQKKMGFDKITLSRWKNYISPKNEAIIKLLLKKEMKVMGYL